jgi:DNA-binding NtrC family response regulator
MCELVAEALSSRGFVVAARASSEQALELLESENYDVVLTELLLGGASGLELCEQISQRRSDICVIVMTAFANLESAVGAIRAGAYDFVTKPVALDALVFTIERATQHLRLQAELKRLHTRVESEELPNMVGDSAALKQVIALVERVARSDATVLITGESGTGKELIAKAVHERSGRKGPFLAINCAAVPDTLLESELFGHTRGAFTDARAARKGLFVEADGGTLFLDEIGDMALPMQTKLLRALQERTVRPVGEATEAPFDARIITATNRDLEIDVAEKRFREDLYYRINVVRIEVPPLRARGNDVLQLAHHFLRCSAARSGKLVNRLGSAVAESLISYDWPGNVRELENCIERAVALATYDEITLKDLPERMQNSKITAAMPAVDEPTELSSMQAIEDRYIRRVLQAVAGNKTIAARILGFDRRTLYRKLATMSEGDDAPRVEQQENRSEPESIGVSTGPCRGTSVNDEPT